MNPTAAPRRSATRRALVAGLTAATAAVLVVSTAPAAGAAPAPVQGPLAAAVTDDALPTAQVNGVVWAQVVVGNTVFVGGSFTAARPAGTAAGSSAEVPRSNLMSYDIRTGVMTSWAPVVNKQVKSLAVSPDGSTLYVGGQFTSVNGKNRQRIAAFNVSSGALSTTFQPGPSYLVNAIAVTSTTVYIGGDFTSVNGVDRSRLAALRASDGALTAWNPGADASVTGLVVTGAPSVVVGGSFANLGTTSSAPTFVRGLGAVDPTTGAVMSFPANQTVYSYGSAAGFTNLSTDGTSVFGTSYNFGGTGNLEGAFSADAKTGKLNWVEDCHGDTYGAYSNGTVVYTVSHAHFCGNVGGFPDSNPRTFYQRAMAFTAATEGTLATNSEGGYADLGGTPAPAIVSWFPTLTTGTYTGQTQAAWSVSGNSNYVVLGGEFPTVNGVAQQGLSRFAVRGIAPGKMGPQVANSSWKVTLDAAPNGQVTVSFPANKDPDDATLTYQIARNSTSSIVRTFTAVSTFWNRPTLSWVDTGAVRGKTNYYTVFATDSTGNRVATMTATVNVP